MAGKKSIMTAHPVVAQTPASTALPKPIWKPELFDSLIYNNGYECFIERALRCPCVERASGQALSTCHNCGGRGWFFVDKRQTRVVAQSMENVRRNTQTGEINRGTARITARASDRMGFMDRVILTQLEAYYTEILNPIVYNEELLAYPVYEPLEVTNIYLYAGDSVKLIPLTPAQYSIEGNKIVFDKALMDLVPSDDMNQKFPEMTISIRYMHNPCYHILDGNRELTKVREHTCAATDADLTQIPMLYVARKAHYIFDQQRFDTDIVDNSVL